MKDSKLILNMYIYIYILVGGFNPSEKYESQIGSSSQLLGTIKNVPNHQSVYTYMYMYIYIYGNQLHDI